MSPWNILTAAWSGEPVRYRGEHYTVEGMRFLPRPVQRPGVPVWVAGFYGKPRGAAAPGRPGYRGSMPVNLDNPGQPDQEPAYDKCSCRAERHRPEHEASARGGRPSSAGRWLVRRGSGTEGLDGAAVTTGPGRDRALSRWRGLAWRAGGVAGQR